MVEVGDDQETIYLTRGDVPLSFSKLAFCLPIYNSDTGKEENYKFQLNDKITFCVKERNGYVKEDIIRIEKTIAEMGYIEPTEYPEIQLTEEDTKKFELLNKRKTYWYDIVLNDTVTILGYDSDGAKKIIVFPEVGERGIS